MPDEARVTVPDEARDAVPDVGPGEVSEPRSEVVPGDAPTPPARRLINRRRLLTGAAALGALAAAAGVNEWARRKNSHGPRLWRTTAASGRLVLSADRQQGLYASGFDGAVRALDPRTGEVRWTRTVGTPDAADAVGGWPLAAGDGVVGVATDTGLRVLDAASGEQRWEATLPDRSEGGWRQGPAIGGGSVFAVYGSSVRCYDLATGEPRWTGPAGAFAALALDGGTVYAAGRPRGLLALDARTGERLWERDLVVSGPLTVHQDGLLVSSPPETMASTIVAALDPATGAQLWASIQHGELSCPLSAAGRTVYLAGGDRLFGLDTRTGDWVWKANTFGSRKGGTPAVVATDNLVYASSGDGRLWAFDPSAGGGMRWQDDSQEAGRISLAAVGGTVYQGGPGGVVALGTLPAPPSA
ncbi:PQQ-binding-like beta-propeller repeat protein [Kitasatospora sp. NPDC057512]|uniref:outer membrane protein assembly factor BamB family protein n=1 Tax=Kitasatospora sp. NPDC057512 TaxID=3346154 RepID=UPI00369A1445